MKTGMKNDDRKRLPGSEKLTRPEDLKSLSKYLGNIRKTQEEHVILDESTLEVPGVTTGYIPEINTLPDSIENLEDGRAISLSDEVENLPESQIKLDDKEQPSALLDQTRIDLRQDKEVVALIDSRVIGLSATDSIESLPDPIEELSVSDDIELTKERVDIDDQTNPALDNTQIQGIQGNSGSDVSRLSDVREDLTDPSDLDLGESKVTIKDESEVHNLSDFLDTIVDKRENSLSDNRLDIVDERDEKLGDHIENLGDILERTDLENTKVGIDFSESHDVALSEKIISGPSDSGQDSLSDEVKRLEDQDKTQSLESDRLDIDPGQEISGLYENSLKTPENPDHTGWDGETVYDSVLEAPEDLEKEYQSLLRADDLSKYTKILEMADNMGSWGSKIASFVSAYLSNDTISTKDAIEFDNKLKDLLSQLGYLKRVYDNSSLLAKKMEEAAIESDTSGSRSGNVFDRYQRNSVVDRPEAANEETYVPESGDPKEENEYSAGEKLLELYKNPYSKESGTGYPTIPTYKLPVRGVLDALNVSDYLRYIAEMTFVNWDPKTMAERKVKETLLNETLALLFLGREQLERLSKSNRDRLPGDDFGMLSDLVSSGVSGAAENLKDNALSALQNTFAGAAGIDKTNPINRPKKNMFTGEREDTEKFDLGNERQEAVDNSLAKNLGTNLTRALIGNMADDALGMNTYSFGKNYLSGSGILKTLEDLCNFTSVGAMSSVEELFQLLKDSNYISTPRHFGTLDKGYYGTMALDTNSYWEITMAPFCNTRMNGGYSFLPAIEEMNIINNVTHGYETRYSKWIPAINFELQKSKVSSKSLGLFDGEIVYPTSAELVNEFRMTLVDDQYKSWRNYFQKCADVSVYSSEAHYYDYYYGGGFADESSRSDFLNPDNFDKGKSITSLRASRSYKDYPTIVDKSKPIAAYYKNITFEIKIYIMTPQYSTIRKFDLLCVLRDFQEDFSGDIDSAGYDLNLNFSIVGENPIYGEEKELVDLSNPKTTWVDNYRNLYETQSNIGRPRNSLIKLL